MAPKSKRARTDDAAMEIPNPGHAIGLGMEIGDALGVGVEDAAAAAVPASGKSHQEKRTCPDCGHRVGPRFGTGKDGEGSQCPGTRPDLGGVRCSYVFTAGRRKMQHRDLVAKCSARQHAPFAEVKAAFQRTARKVVAEAAKTGGTAVLFWYNTVEEDITESKELSKMVQRTIKQDTQKVPMREGEYAYRVNGHGSGIIHKCCVVMQTSTGTEAAENILEHTAPMAHVTAVQTLQKLADKAAIDMAVAQHPQAAVSVKGASSGDPVTDLGNFLKSIGQYDSCFTPLCQNGLTLDVMQAIIVANGKDMSGFVDALKVAGLTPGHAMVLYAHLNK